MRKKVLAVVSMLIVVVLASATPLVWAGGWQHTSNGPYGGVIQALALDYSGNVYAGVYQGWLYKSTDAGATWTLKKGAPNPIGNNARDIRALATVPVAGGAIYAGSYGGGVYKSTNGADTWSVMNTGLTNLNVLSLLVDPNAFDTVYAGTEGIGVFKWAGSGPWQLMNAGALSALVETLAMDSGGTLYLGRRDDGSDYGVYAWNGSSWQAMNTGLPANTTVKSLLADGTNLWAATPGQGVYYWNGSTWAERNNGLAGDALNVWRVAADGNGDVYAGTRDGLYYWDGGQWQLRDSGLEGNGRKVRDLVSPSGNTLYAGTDGRGVWKSPDGGASWAETNTGLSGYVVRAIGINPQYDWRVYAGTFRGGIFWSADGGGSWSWRSNGLGDVEVEAIAVTSPGGTPVYAGINGQGVYRTDDLGLNWVAKNNGLTGNALKVFALAIKPVENSPVVYAGTTDGLYKTLDSGENWSQACTGLNYPVSALAVDIRPTYTDTIYIGTSSEGVYYSTDGGDQCDPLGSLPDSDSKTILSLAADETGIVRAGTEDGIYKWQDNQWQTNGFQEFPIYALAVNPVSQTVLYAGSESPVGVVVTETGYWEPMNDGLANLNVASLTIDDYYTQTLHAGTIGSSVWDYTFGDPPPLAPELGIDLDDGVSVVETGDVLSYTITYYNAGVVDALDAFITMTLPTHTDYVSSDPQFTEISPGLYRLDLDLLQLETVYEAHFYAKVKDDPPPFLIEAAAGIGDYGGNPPDPFLLNNHDTDKDQVPLIDVSFMLNKQAEPLSGSTVSPTQRITYTLSYENTGTDAATGVVLTDVLPNHVTYVPGSIWPLGQGDDSAAPVLSWNIGSVPAGSGGSAGFVVTVNEDPPHGFRIANTFAIDSQETPAVSSSEVEHFVDNPAPNFSLSKTAAPAHGSSVQPGDRITYTLGYVNESGMKVTGFTLTDTLPAYVTYVPGSIWPAGQGDDSDPTQLRWTVGEVLTDATGTARFVVTVNDVPGSLEIQNQFAASSDQTDLVSSPVVTHTTYREAPDFAISSIEVSPESPSPGQPFDLIVTVENIGSQDATTPTLWVEVYVKPDPWTPPSGPADHYLGICADQSCTPPYRWEYVEGLMSLGSGTSFPLHFTGLELPGPGRHMIYAQADVSFEGDDPVWGPYIEQDESNNMNSILVGPNVVYLPVIKKNH